MLAQVVVDADRAECLGNARAGLQRLEHPFQARGGKIVTGETNGAIVGEAQTLQQDDPAAAADAEAVGDAAIGGDFTQLTDDAGRLRVMFSYPFGKPRTGFDIVVEDVLGDE